MPFTERKIVPEAPVITEYICDLCEAKVDPWNDGLVRHEGWHRAQRIEVSYLPYFPEIPKFDTIVVHLTDEKSGNDWLRADDESRTTQLEWDGPGPYCVERYEGYLGGGEYGPGAKLRPARQVLYELHEARNQIDRIMEEGLKIVSAPMCRWCSTQHHRWVECPDPIP